MRAGSVMGGASTRPLLADVRPVDVLLWLGAGLLIGAALSGCGPGDRPGEGDDDGDGGGGFIDGGHGPDEFGPDAAPSDECGVLRLTIRDFSDQHPDFEGDFGEPDYAYPGLVEDTLGADKKPVYVASGPTAVTTGPDEFNQWYRDVPGVNEAFPISIALTATGDGRWVYDSAAFFPIDGKGFGNEGRAHNFHFTSEVHTAFEYKGGEVFTFDGDDDLWLFINNKLAIDLGGLHPALSATVDLDASAAQLGITPGHTYPMDIFHAERHTDASNFHIETTIECIVIP